MTEAVPDRKSLRDRVNILLDEAAMSNMGSLSRWIETAGGTKEALLDKILSDPKVADLNPDDSYLYWSPGDWHRPILPYLTNREGVLRAKIIEELDSLMNDGDVEVQEDQFQRKSAVKNIREQNYFMQCVEGFTYSSLVNFLLQLALSKETVTPDISNTLYINSPDSDHGWQITSDWEMDIEFDGYDPCGSEWEKDKEIIEEAIRRALLKSISYG